MNASPDSPSIVSLVPDWASLEAQVAVRLSRPLPDPFGIDIVCVTGLGHQRELSQAIARKLGVTAGIEFMTVGRLRSRLEHDLLGIDPDSDPWRDSGLLLAISEVVANDDDPIFAPVRRHVSTDRLGRSIALASRIARIFRRCLNEAPDMLEAWAAGGNDGPTGPLPQHLAWQPELWRRVETLLTPVSDPLRRHRELVSTLSQAASLPPRITVIGRDGLPSRDIELILRLSRHSDVAVIQLDALDAAHPLAARLGATRRASVAAWGPARRIVRPLTTDTPETVLALMQSDIRAGRPCIPYPGRHADSSVQVHASHGPDRQVEVLREVVTGLFADDPTLEPRDVVVACCDLPAYASLLSAAFLPGGSDDASDTHPARSLRVQLSRVVLAPPNPALDAIRSIYQLRFGRATVRDLIDLCSRPVVARKFSFSEDNLATIRSLIDDAGIVWGIDDTHRNEQGFTAPQPGTWNQGLDRIMLGAALGDHPLGWLGRTMPVTQLQSSDVDLAGRLSELVSRVRFALMQSRTPAPMVEWAERIRSVIDSLIAIEPNDAWQVTTICERLTDLARRGVGRQATYELGDALAMLEEISPSLGGRPNYGNGSLLVCGLDDLAGIERRVVCVLGLDDEHFLTLRATHGDDPLGSHDLAPHIDPAALSRQHLLDAVLAATDALVLVGRGASEVTNSLVGPCVAMHDIINACGLDPELDDGWPSEREAARRRQGHRQLVSLHTLQPYDPDNFRAGPDSPPLSFDPIAWRGALQSYQNTEPSRERPHPWLTLFPSRTSEAPINLDDLIDFFRSPAKQLLRHALGVSLADFDESPHNELLIELDGLQQWGIGSRLIDGLVAGESLDRLWAAERLCGKIPPPGLEMTRLANIQRHAMTIADAARPLLAQGTRVIDVDVAIAGTRLVGSVVIHGSRVVSYTYSNSSGKWLIPTWLRVLALGAAGEQMSATLLTRSHTYRFSPPSAAESTDLLEALIGLYQAGLTQLLPLPPNTSAHMAGVQVKQPYRKRSSDRRSTIEVAWEAECKDEWGHFGLRTLAQLTSIHHPAGTFANLACLLWNPVISHTQVSTKERA